MRRQLQEALAVASQQRGELDQVRGLQQMIHETSVVDAWPGTPHSSAAAY